MSPMTARREKVRASLYAAYSIYDRKRGADLKQPAMIVSSTVLGQDVQDHVNR